MSFISIDHAEITGITGSGVSGFVGDITGFTVGAANGVVVDGTIAGGTVTLQLPGDLGTGTYNATVFNGTESALISFAFTQPPRNFAAAGGAWPT